MPATDRNFRIRFADNNYMADPDVTITASSAISGNSFANVYDQKRFKSWIPEGAFEITTLNQNIYINDGADKIVAVTPGVYNGATLAFLLEGALNAASSGWTVTYDAAADYTFYITNVAAVTLRQSTTASAIWDVLGYLDGIDIVGTTFLADEPRIHTSEYFEIDLGAPAPVDFVSLIPPADQRLGLSQGATVTVKGSNINDFVTPDITLNMTVEDLGAFLFTDDQTNVDYRYWRVDIVDRTNTAGPNNLEVGYIYLGTYTTISLMNVAPEFSKTLVDPSNVFTTEAGTKYTRERPRYKRYQGLQIGLIRDDDRKIIEQIYYDFGIRRPLIVSIDPLLCASSEYADLTRYVRFDGDPDYTHVRSDIYNVEFSLVEEI